jgi:hypothetical protein
MKTGMRDAPYLDSTPKLHVGSSSFEDWFQAHEKACTGDKQLARDAYAAGMGDPLVTYATPSTEALLKVKTADMTTRQMNWAVAICLGFTEFDFWHTGAVTTRYENGVTVHHAYCDNWAQGGPIIDQMKSYCQEKNEETGECYCSTLSVAEDWHNHPVAGLGSTPLIAAMRCFLASRLGDEIGMPKELQ